MTIFLKPAVLAVAIGLGANAAGAATMSGKIEHIYPSEHKKIVLDKHVFHMSPQTFHSSRLHRGETVHVTYHWANGHRWATGVKTA